MARTQVGVNMVPGVEGHAMLGPNRGNNTTITHQARPREVGRTSMTSNIAKAHTRDATIKQDDAFMKGCDAMNRDANAIRSG